MIHVIATIELNSGTREAFLDEFRKIIPEVHAEDGCLAYGPTVDLATGLPAQVGPRDDVVTIVEQWESLEHLQAHLQAAHMVAYRERVKGYVHGMTLQVLQPV